MSTFTPGPWRIVPREVLEDGSVYPTHITGGVADVQVCLMESPTVAGLIQNDPAWKANGCSGFISANARLIAAAPTTAEKAMAFTFIVERFMRGDVPQGVKPATEAEVAEAMYELRNHIAKATGAAA